MWARSKRENGCWFLKNTSVLMCYLKSHDDTYQWFCSTGRCGRSRGIAPRPGSSPPWCSLPTRCPRSPCIPCPGSPATNTRNTINLCFCWILFMYLQALLEFCQKIRKKWKIDYIRHYDQVTTIPRVLVEFCIISSTFLTFQYHLVIFLGLWSPSEFTPFFSHLYGHI